MFVGATIIPAYAVSFESKGGPKIKSEDGNFELGINARAHLDVHAFSRDRASAFPPFVSQLDTGEERSGFNWRRTYTTLTGRIYGLNFKFENDFAAGDFPGSIRETWVSADLGPERLALHAQLLFDRGCNRQCGSRHDGIARIIRP
ncbi:phosphate-selective porin OprO and OprP [Nitrosovibrio sp. Nv6]|nr:phosphate-selective porin OprO and OprP [Nitrosovibrio sp. Nv6]